MFRNIPQSVEVTQGHLKALEAWRAAQGMEPKRQLRQVTKETGKLLALLLANCPKGDAVELGTGAGYSALWLALACRAGGRRLVTLENDAAKLELARHCLDAAGVLDVVDLREGDALEGLKSLSNYSFCFLDADRALVTQAYELALAALPTGGLIVVDNATSHAQDMAQFLFDLEVDARVDMVIVPNETGLLLCRKV